MSLLSGVISQALGIQVNAEFISFSLVAPYTEDTLNPAGGKHHTRNSPPPFYSSSHETRK